MKRVAVAMSGGVDSSVAAVLLKRRGFDVFGISMRLFTPKQNTQSRYGSCCSIEDVHVAKRAAHVLGIPHYTLNLEKQFERSVIHNFVEEYMAGKTPNPCIVCNRAVKFDILLKKVLAMGADYLATGHYIIKKRQGNKFILEKGNDPVKDQSYFLYDLGQRELKNLLFPVGKHTKSHVREIARKMKLPNAEKKESQEICFIEDKNYGSFLKKYSAAQVGPGPIYDVSGEKIGTHKGFPFYTIGQRKGLNLGPRGPKFVVEIIPKDNTLIVGDQQETEAKTIFADHVSWVAGNPPKKNCTIKAQIRYRHVPAEALMELQDTDLIKLVFKYAQNAITPGQAVVLYQGRKLLGGGTIRQ